MASPASPVQPNQIQTTQMIPAKAAQPGVINEMPEEVLLLILEKIFDVGSVANLNLVSKNIRRLNQDSGINCVRAAARFAENEDLGLVNEIRAQFTNGSDPVPNVAVVNYLLVRFTEIKKEALKMEAFSIVLNAANANDDISKKFYNALPAGAMSEFALIAGFREASQTSFRHQMFRVNGDSVYGGINHGLHFGQFMVDHEIRSSLSRTAVRRLADFLHLETFLPAIGTPSATDDSVRKAFSDLPQALKNEIYHQIWNINHINGGSDNGDENYGANVVKNTPRDAKVANAALQLRNEKL